MPINVASVESTVQINIIYSYQPRRFFLIAWGYNFLITTISSIVVTMLS